MDSAPSFMAIEQVEGFKTVVAGRWNRHSSYYLSTQGLWRARNRFDAGKESTTDLGKEQDEVTRLLLNSLDESGVDLVGDGGFRWDSAFDVTRRIKGCSGFNQLDRIPKTNHFHRKPIAGLPLSREHSLLVDDLRFAQALTSRSVVVSLPGPYSTARQTQNVGEVGLRALTLAYADVFNQEAADLIRHGAAFVRIEDPQILDYPEDMADVKEAMERLANGIDKTRLALATWFGDTKDPDFFKLPFGIFCVDFVNGKGSIKALEQFPSDKRLVAGIIDAQHPYRETQEELSALVGEITRYVSPDRVLLAPNTDLHFLPWDEAVSKIHNLVEFATKYHSGIPQEDTSEISAPKRIISSTFTTTDVPERINVSKSPISRIAFPTSTVGSFPQHAELRMARVALKKGTVGIEEYLDLVSRYTEQWMRVQDRLGVTLPVSGEFLRDDMAAYFGRAWGGEEGDFVPSFENRRYHPIIYADRLQHGQPVTVKEFQYLQSISDRPVKHTVTGPATMADWALLKYPPYYLDQNGFRTEMAQAVRSEIKALIDAGASTIQVDEPALTTKMRRLSGDLQAIYDSIAGFENSAYLILHICYSDMKALDEAFSDILKLPFHQIHMETANRGYTPLQLVEKHGLGGKDIGLGVLDVHNDRVETVDEIVAGVGKARKLFPPEQIWLTPDCGLKDRSVEVTIAKLTAMSEAAKISRAVLV